MWDEVKYRFWCIFDEHLKCPLYQEDGMQMDIDGGLCGACVDMNTLKGLKAQMIAQLLIHFQSEEKAKEVYDRIGKLMEEW